MHNHDIMKEAKFVFKIDLKYKGRDNFSQRYKDDSRAATNAVLLPLAMFLSLWSRSRRWEHIIPYFPTLSSVMLKQGHKYQPMLRYNNKKRKKELLT